MVVQWSSEASSESLSRFSYTFVDIVLNLVVWLKTCLCSLGRRYTIVSLVNSNTLEGTGNCKYLSSHYILKYYCFDLRRLCGDANLVLYSRIWAPWEPGPFPPSLHKLLCIPTSCYSVFWNICWISEFRHVAGENPTNIQHRDIIIAKYFAILLPLHKMAQPFW